MAIDSLRVTEGRAKAAAKTPNRVSLDVIEAEIMEVEQLDPPRMCQHMTILAMTFRNGFVVIGKSAPADAKNYDRQLGIDFAREDCIRQAWPLFGFSLRGKLMDRQSDAYGGG